MTIDAHVHLWRLARGDNVSLSPDMTAIYRDLEPPDVQPRLAAAGVSRIVVVQAAETLAEALFVTGLARKHPRIAAIVAWIEPASPAVEEEAAALSWLPIIKGVRPIRDDNRSIAWMLDKRLGCGWRALADNGLSLDILVQNWREIPLATALAAEWPQLTIVLDHCGKPDIAGRQFEPWARSITDLARLPNVHCKLSGLMNCAPPLADTGDVKPYADHVLQAFGAGRVMWASDWPPLDLASSYQEWKRISDELLASLEDADRRQVLAGTAERVYRIAPS